MKKAIDHEQKGLEQFMEQAGSNMALTHILRNQLDSDGNLSADTVIDLGSAQQPRRQQLRIQQ
ncbi:uncharacterized protein METZ01_LOCUS105263 [marine metagenome]|uniref:Uncharacterized protein n=1 Tax=marine metagenome TaxID=408172 RepID=A0A381WIX8_9ZZZZ